MGRALVTGGAGFIGSHIAAALERRGAQVRILDDLSTGEQENLASLDAELVVGDIRDAGLVQRVMEGVGWVFHQAAFVSVPASVEDPIDCYEINLQGSLNLLWAAHKASVKVVVLASSAAVYGESPDQVDEGSPKVPLSPYAAAKLAMEGAAKLFSSHYGLATVCLRYFNVYGPRQRPDSPYAAVIPAFARAMIDGQPATIFGDGDQRRDFVYVEDVVRANLLAAERKGAIGGIFNIGGGGSISIRELAGILQGLLPEAPDPTFGAAREGDIYFSQASLDRAEQALGYRPEVSMEEGLRSTVEWFRQQRLKTPS